MKRLNLFLILLVGCIFAGVSAADSFKIVALPDTQVYSEDYPATFNDQTQWVVDHVGDATPIAFVTHLGDVVNKSYESYQWTNADTAMDKLDGVVPYSICIGNHDYSDHRDPNLIPYKQVGAAEFIAKFGPLRFSSYTWYKGYHGTGLNCYQIFTAGGRQWLHLNLEYEPDDEVLLWAQRIIDANPTLPVIISTHAYLSSSGLLGGTGDEFGHEADNGGRNMWYRFVSHNDQIFLVINGHYPGAALLTSQNDYGRDVYQVVADYQHFPNGGNGYLRTLEFNMSTNQILVKTYSPTLGTYLTDDANQFNLNINFTTRLSSFSSRETVSTVQGGNIVVSEVNSLNLNEVALSIPTGQKTSQFSLIPPGTATYTENNKGDYYIKAGNIAEDDALNGIYIASVAENSRQSIDPNDPNVYHHTISASANGQGAGLINVSRTSMYLDANDANTLVEGGVEGNVNFSAAYFPFSGGWTCGRVVHLDNGQQSWGFVGSPDVQLGVNLTQYSTATNPARPRVGANGFQTTDSDRGIWRLSIPGVDTLKDGVLLVCGGKNESNYASASPEADGIGWIICVRGNTSDGTGTETDPFNFVYVPFETPGIVAGRITTDGGIANGTGGFRVERTELGVHKLTIDGYTPADGVLIISDELEDSAIDNFTTYQPEGDHWIINNRDLPAAVLEGGSNPIYSFVFIPFANPPAGPGLSRVFNPTKLLAGNFSAEWDAVHSLVSVYKDQGSEELTEYRHGLGDYYLAINGNYELNNNDNGLLFASTREFFRDDGDGSGTYFPLICTRPENFYLPVNRGDSSTAEGNADFSVVWLTSESMDTFGWQSATSGTHDMRNPLHGYAVTITPNYGADGRYKLVFDSIDPDDGVLFVQARTGSPRVASVMPVSDGWEVATRDGISTMYYYNPTTFAYVFFPYNVPVGRGEYEVAQVAADGTIIAYSSPVFTVNHTGTGTYTLDITGATPEDGALLVQSYQGNENGPSATTMAYQPNGTSFDLRIFALNGVGDPVDKDFIVIYIPFVNPPYNPDVPANGSGTPADPYQIWNQSDLEKVKNATGAYFVQRANINLSGTTYTAAVVSATFTGNYNGNGFKIQNLTFSTSINSAYIGLFNTIGTGAAVSNLTLENVSMLLTQSGDDNLGCLAGKNQGNITNCHASGTISGNDAVGGLVGFSSGGTITGCSAAVSVTSDYRRVGGLVGNFDSGTISNSYATGDVTGVTYVGGLIGRHVPAAGYTCNVLNCYATGNVTGNILGGGPYTGGLIGLVGGNGSSSVMDCHATGTVNGGNSTGGLMGDSEETVTNCYATGAVTGTEHVGGLIGLAKNAESLSSNCYATGNVSGTIGGVGGLVGYFRNNAQMTRCYATGNVTATDANVGGFVGFYQLSTSGFISDSYATGAVSSPGTLKAVGGFAGQAEWTIKSCYSTGLVTNSGTAVGGFAGSNTGSVIDANCFWDTQTSGQATSAGGTGKITTQMKTQSTFTNAGWNFVSTWKIRESATYPKLMWQAFGGDIDWDGDVDFVDLRLLVNNWLATGTGLDGDIYVDNTVNFLDFAQFASDWAQR